MLLTDVHREQDHPNSSVFGKRPSPMHAHSTQQAQLLEFRDDTHQEPKDEEKPEMTEENYNCPAGLSKSPVLMLSLPQQRTVHRQCVGCKNGSTALSTAQWDNFPKTYYSSHSLPWDTRLCFVSLASCSRFFRRRFGASTSPSQ